MRLGAPYWGMLAFLLALIGFTWGAQHWRVSHVEETIEAQQEAVVTAAFERIQAEFTAMQEGLYARGVDMAQHPVVLAALQQENPEKQHGLIRLFSRLELPDRWAVELYDTSFELIAWSGFSMPLDGGAFRSIASPHTAIAEDGDWRRALVVWVPVRNLGVVRVMQLIQARTPVQNEFLRDYSVGDAWQRGIRLPVRTQFETPDAGKDSVRALLLKGFDGIALGRVAVEPPYPEQLLELTKRRFADVIAFWATLLLVWLLSGFWIWHRSSPRRVTVSIRLCILGVFLWIVRYGLLVLDVPARWQLGKAPLNVLFDPSHMASSLGGGLMRSTGDLLVTAIFAVLYALAVFGYARSYYTTVGSWSELCQRLLHTAVPRRFLGGMAIVTALSLGLVCVLAMIAHRTGLDSTLNFFGRDALIPEPLILVVSYALILGTLSVILLITSLTWIVIGITVDQKMRPKRISPWILFPGLLGAIAAPLAAIYFLFGLPEWVPWLLPIIFIMTGFLLAARGYIDTAIHFRWLTLRSVLFIMFLMGVLVYPLLYQGLDERRRYRMEHAAATFDQREDPHVLFAVRNLLSVGHRELLKAREEAPVVFDTLAAGVLHNSLLSSMSIYDVSLVFLDSMGSITGRSDMGVDGEDLNQVTTQLFDQLRKEVGENSPSFVRSLPSLRDADGLRYAGVFQVRGEGAGWILVSAEPHLLIEEANTPLLRILVSAGNSSLYDDLSLGVFSNGMLIHSLGRSFRRYRLDEDVARDLAVQPAQWRKEEIKGRRYQTYYRSEEGRVVAARISTVSAFDHLYYLLRITVAGLLVGLPFYVIGLILRRQAGRLPALRVQFRDKVLNAFLAVGIFAVVTVGFVGVNVVTEENNRAIQSWLRQHLQRVQDILTLEAEGEEMPYSVLERISLDSLAAQVGLDLNLFQNDQLQVSSRPELVSERLIDRRLPMRAREALNMEGFQLAFVEDKIGAFTYTAGYWALFDDQGEPYAVLSVPTLPEQGRIEEERSRTLAYLFGALLALLMLVMGTASLLANALSRPIARLRQGLTAVAQGRFEGRLPVETRDEVGELVETFNDMQERLAETQQQLSQQERQLAWSEMARQVAHEIRNPLTPMKLSLQHLRRAYAESVAKSQSRFGELFDRITTTLVEQIDSLAHIANEFASFGRMPARITERLDCNEVIKEVVSLMQEEAASRIDITLQVGTEPLIVEGDREELRRVYINLVKNALEAFDDDQEGRVVVSAHRDANEVYSAVADTGKGIALEQQERIFEPNFSTKTSGTGLGLAIVRRCVETMGGSIGCETEPGEGTTFWMRLPRQHLEKNI